MDANLLEVDKTYKDACETAQKLSLEHAGKYVTLFTCFGIFAFISKSLDVQAPSDSLGGYYWLNGKRKPFTKAQKIADDLATPMLS